jgi:hypothetical protein
LRNRFGFSKLLDVDALTRLFTSVYSARESVRRID